MVVLVGHFSRANLGHFSRVPKFSNISSGGHWGAAEGEMGGNGSNNIFYSSTGAAESEIDPATFFAATLGAPPRAKWAEMGPTMLFAAALARPRVK
jgi:hypothetical protein